MDLLSLCALRRIRGTTLRLHRFRTTTLHSTHHYRLPLEYELAGLVRVQSREMLEIECGKGRYAWQTAMGY